MGYEPTDLPDSEGDLAPVQLDAAERALVAINGLQDLEHVDCGRRCYAKRCVTCTSTDWSGVCPTSSTACDFGREVLVVGVRQAGLEIADDRAEKARREKTRPEGTGRILTDGRQLSQGGSGLRGHTVKLPADLLDDRFRPAGSGQSSRLGGIRGGTQSVRAHVRDGGGLPGRSCGGNRCRRADIAGSGTADETAADLPRNAKLATGKGACSGDRITGAGIPRSFRLEQSQHPLSAVRRPPSDDPPLGFAQRLWRTHSRILPRVTAPGPPCRGSVNRTPPSALRRGIPQGDVLRPALSSAGRGYSAWIACFSHDR